MPTIAQGTRKITVLKKQTGLGVPAIGAGGQILRRRTSVFQAPRETFESDEIVSHHQSTGIGYGLKSASGRLDGLLSAGTYATAFAALLERLFTAGASAAAVSITTAGAGPYTLTRSAGSWLTDGFKVGDVIRTSAAGNANNINKNLWVTGVTALVLTVIVLNGTTLTAEGPIAGVTITVVGKKTYAPMTAHTNEYFTVEEWYADIARSELFPDMRFAQAAIGLPATGNSTVSFDMVGLNRTLAGTQQLTSPAAETTTSVMAAVNGLLMVNGVQQSVVTGVQFNLGNNAANVGGVVGANVSPDVARGRIRVAGSFTAMFDSNTIQAIYDAESAVALQMVTAADKTATSDFLSWVLGRIKLTGDTPDDGEKGIVRTYPFTAEINGAGGAALAYDQTILSLQDSAAA
jgi:hypothetical protein